jgi:DNA-binding XRE family transcriptional regulator
MTIKITPHFPEIHPKLKSLDNFREKLAVGEEELIPAEFVNRMIDGENKIKVWRDYRGMSAKALADAAGISAAYLSQIEKGVREGSLDTMKKIAEALKVTIGELV